MPTALDMAMTVLGKTEGRDRAALMDYLKTGGVNLDPATTAWCAAFVNSSLEQAGYSGTGSNLARSFLEWGNAVEGTPQPGDVAVYPRGNDPKLGHVGFVQSVDPKTGMVTLLAGNQSDAVGTGQYALNAALGYRRPTGLPAGSYPEGHKGEEAYPPPVTAKAPAGPVEAAGGGAGSDAPYTAGTAPAASPATAGAEKTTDPWWKRAAKGLATAGTPATGQNPGYPLSPQTPAAITQVAPAANVNVQQGEAQRQQLAAVMARLNSGQLWG